MTLSAIVAVTENNVIGKDNDLPWSLPDDMRYFMRTTTGHHVIMGRKNFASMDFKPLKNRTNIVLTKDPYFLASGVFVFQDLQPALTFCEERDETEAFIIGGAQIYELAMPLIDRLYLTRIHGEIEGDIFFPEWDSSQFIEVSQKKHKADHRHAYDYTFHVFDRLAKEA